MLEPKRRKHRKTFRGRMRGKGLRGSTLSFGDFGLKAMESAWLASNVIEAGRKGITHHLKKGGRMWIRIFPDKPVTARPAGQRMGSGKGDIDRYVAVIKPGTIIYEVTGIDVTLARTAFAKAAAKMPFKTKFVTKGD